MLCVGHCLIKHLPEGHENTPSDAHTYTLWVRDPLIAAGNVTFQTGWMKAQIIPGEEWSCGDWEREWAMLLLLSSSVPMCWGAFLPNLINLPSLPLPTAQEANPKPKSKQRGEPVLQQRWEVGSGCEKVSPPVCAICKLSPASRLLKRQVVHSQTCSYHLIIFTSKGRKCVSHLFENKHISQIYHT